MVTDETDSDVWITGIGMVTPVGVGREESWTGFSEGRSGVGAIRSYHADSEPIRIAAEVPEHFEEAYRKRVRIPFARRFARFTRLALFAGEEAIEDSGLDLSAEDPFRIGVVMGVGGGAVHYMGPLEEALSGGPLSLEDVIDHNFVVKTMLNAPAGMLSMRHGLQGPSSIIGAACASGAYAISTAASWLQSHRVDVMLAGGTDSTVSKLTLLAYHRVGALSSANGLGSRASRPFDRDRSGFIMGEGSAVLVLETARHARDRGARRYARLSGSGLVSEAYRMATPRSDGSAMARAMEEALKSAGADETEVAFINANAASTPVGDSAEALAIHRLFGERARRIPVTAPKSMMGHPIGASAAIQVALTAMTIRHGLIPPTANLDHLDSGIDLDVVRGEAREQVVPLAICNAFGFGGHNASLAMRK